MLIQDRQVAVGKIKDLTSHLGSDTQPFLYYLPRLMERQLLDFPSYTGLVNFIEKALAPNHLPLIDDALLILNQLVEREDGTLVTPRQSMFSDNSHFFWKELGNNTDTKSVVHHVINKVALFLSLGR